VERLASEGATVAIFDINKAAGKQVAAEFCSKNFNVKFFDVDVSNKEGCIEATKQFAEMNNGKIHFHGQLCCVFWVKRLDCRKERLGQEL